MVNTNMGNTNKTVKISLIYNKFLKYERKNFTLANNE